MKCKYCKEEIVVVKTAGGKDVWIDFKSLTHHDIQYAIQVDCEKYPILYRPNDHTVHFVTHPDCKGQWTRKKNDKITEQEKQQSIFDNS